MGNKDIDQKSSSPADPARSKETGAVRLHDRRRRHPGILSKLASSHPEAAAIALLKGELTLPLPGLCRDREQDYGEDATGQDVLPKNGLED